LRRLLNKAYADSAFKPAKAIVDGCLATGGDPRKVKIRKLFIVSEGESSRFGNRNVRFEATSLVKVKYPYDGSWIILRAEFGGKYLPLLRELVELAKQKKASYNAKIGSGIVESTSTSPYPSSSTSSTSGREMLAKS